MKKTLLIIALVNLGLQLYAQENSAIGSLSIDSTIIKQQLNGLAPSSNHSYFFDGIGYPDKASSPNSEEPDYLMPTNTSSMTTESCLVSRLFLNGGYDYINDVPLTPGSNDSRWVVIDDGGQGGTLPRPAYAIATHPAWKNPLYGSWISAFPTNKFTNTGNYEFEYTFCLDGTPGVAYDAHLNLFMRTDNNSVVFLNGHQLGTTDLASFRYNNPTQISTTNQSFFLDGENKILIRNTNLHVVMGVEVSGTVDTYQTGSQNTLAKIEKGCCDDNGAITGIVYDDLPTTPAGYDVLDNEYENQTILLSNINTGYSRTTTTDKFGIYTFNSVPASNGNSYIVQVNPLLPFHTGIDPATSAQVPLPARGLLVSQGGVSRADFDIEAPSSCNLDVGLLLINGNCVGERVFFDFDLLTYQNSINPYNITSYSWVIDGTVNLIGKNISYVFEEEKTYTIQLLLQTSNPQNPNCAFISIPTSIEIINCIACNDCVPVFNPEPGERYILSAWVKEPNWLQKTTFNDANITLFFDGPNTSIPNIKAEGPIIDGWQRIMRDFVIPESTVAIELQIYNTEAYYDDIRIHPFEASMTSYVYDSQTGKLVAEQNEENFSTFYEYDEEGNMVRIKKETERGIKTITESHQRIKKQ